jgi:hypothetical protein
MIICNSFSLSMLPEWVASGQVRFRRLTLEEARDYVASLGYTSAVGHADTAVVFSQLLGASVPVSRRRASFVPGIEEHILVGQYTGPRLPEGATTLPEGAEIQWILVTFSEDDIEEFAPDVWNGEGEGE